MREMFIEGTRTVAALARVARPARVGDAQRTSAIGCGNTAYDFVIKCAPSAHSQARLALSGSSPDARCGRRAWRSVTRRRASLRASLDEEVRAIAYPVSLSAGEHDEIFAAVRTAGYELGFSTSCGLGPLGAKTNPLDIQRIWVDPNLSHSYFRAAVAVPHLTYRRR